MNDAVKLLAKHGYCVMVKQHFDDSVEVSFPANRSMKLKAETYKYKIDDDTLTFEHNGKSKKYKVSPNCLRLAIICDIIVKCSARSIKRKLVLGYNKDGQHVTDTLNLLGPPPEDVKKEERLFHLISSRDLNKKTEKLAEQEGLLKEYEDIVTIYDKRNGLTV